jgi:uncharacterized protein YbcI
MHKPSLSVAQQVAEAAGAFERQRTGHAPKSITVILCEETLIITLRGALSPAEMALAQSLSGAAHVQEFHRLLFATASDSFRQEIARIVGTEIREAAAEVAAEAVAHVFTTGTVVQVFLLSQRVPTDIWSGSAGQF